METIQKIVNDRPDSLEQGTPSKGGAIKVYFNAQNIEEAKQLIDNALEIRAYAQAKIEVNFNG